MGMMRRGQYCGPGGYTCLDVGAVSISPAGNRNVSGVEPEAFCRTVRQRVDPKGLQTRMLCMRSDILKVITPLL